MGKEITKKYESLKRALASMKSALLSYSGGVDSTVLLAVGKEALGKNLIAVTIISPLQPEAGSTASRIAGELGVRHLSVEINELADPVLSQNPPERCYICKRKRFKVLLELSEKKGVAEVIDGSNRDDLSEYRPGLRAASELGIRSPLIEMGLSKDEVRGIARLLGLPNWDEPPSTCYATRIPYGQNITTEKIFTIQQGEKFLEELGFGQIRLRYVDEKTARIELAPRLIPKIVSDDIRRRVIEEMRRLGFTYVTLDMAGYRPGSMNEALGNEHAPKRLQA